MGSKLWNNLLSQIRDSEVYLNLNPS